MQDSGLAPELARAPSFSLREEIAHSVTHGFGVLLSIAGLAVLVTLASLHGTARDVVGAAVFGSSLVLLYTASTLYHSIQTSRARPILRLLDHSSIYLLIAGTYTPIALRKLPAVTGSVLLAVLWTAALVGIVLTATLRQRFRAASMVLYVGMGWSALLVAGPLARAMGGAGMALIVAGGVAYTVGIAFYALRRVPYHHVIWHLCVLAGSILHYFAVLLYVIPRPLATSRPPSDGAREALSRSCQVGVEGHGDVAHQQTAGRSHLHGVGVESHEAVVGQRLQAGELGAEVAVEVNAEPLLDGCLVDAEVAHQAQDDVAAQDVLVVEEETAAGGEAVAVEGRAVVTHSARVLGEAAARRLGA